MGAIASLHGALDASLNLPGIRSLRRAVFDRRFETATSAHLFRGVFDTLDDAITSAPKSRAVGYDNPASADLYVDRLRIDEHDYPAMFWTADAIHHGARRIVDLGGSIGIKYYAFNEYVDFPQELIWQVIDVPAVTVRGREFALGRPRTRGLEFSDHLSAADQADVLFASGSLQYLPESLPQILDGLGRKPRRIVINTTPIHPTRSFFTLNNIGTAYCPYRVQARESFIAGVMARGYTLRGEWKNIGKRLSLPFEDGLSLNHYCGFCFEANR